MGEGGGGRGRWGEIVGERGRGGEGDGVRLRERENTFAFSLWWNMSSRVCENLSILTRW